MSNTTIQLKKSLTPGSIPSSLEYGELALNAADGILYYKDPGNNIQQITSSASSNSFSTINVGTTLLVATNPNDILSISGNNGITVSGNFVNDTIEFSVDSANTNKKGVVQLYDYVDSDSIELAATANSVNSVYSLAKAAYDKSYTLSNDIFVEELISSDNQSVINVSGGYTVDKIKVFLNGVLLNSSDYIATDGNTIILSVPASNNDIITTEKWDSSTFSLAHGGIDSGELITSSNSSNQILDSFLPNLYRSVKYQIQVTSSTDYQVSEVVLLHNGTNSFFTEFGLITTNGILMSYDTDINSGSVRLLCTPTNSVNTIKFVKTSVMV